MMASLTEPLLKGNAGIVHPDLEVVAPENNAGIEHPEYPDVQVVAPENNAGIEPEYPDVQVVAPENLHAGFRFVATLECGRPFEVTVPDGGVIEGQSFKVPYPTVFLPTSILPPQGRWRVGLFDCCGKELCCTPMSWLAWCFPFVAMGQILTRLRFSWFGTPTGAEEATNNTFKNLLILTIVLAVISIIIGSIKKSIGYGFTVDGIINFITGVFLVHLIAVARLAIRKKSDIPARACGCECGVVEDVCCAFWCTPCTICQMAGHTADYTNYPSMCCTRTGLPDDAPTFLPGKVPIIVSAEPDKAPIVVAEELDEAPIVVAEELDDAPITVTEELDKEPTDLAAVVL